jgi:hypothetical protein
MALLARRLVPVLNGCEDAFWAGGPGEWLGIGFGIDDEAVDGELQVNDRLEDAALKALALELREDAFHGVKPGRGGRRKVERLTRMTRQPSAYLWVLGGGIIVDDGTDHLSHRGRCAGLLTSGTPQVEPPEERLRENDRR